MPRDIEAAVVTASTEAVIYPVLMADFDFSSGHTRVHSGVGTITFGGNTFNGLGQLGKVSPIEEGVELSASGVKVSLSGVDPSKISIAFGTHYQGRAAIIYIALLDSDGVVIADPVIIFQGRMDNMNATLGNEGVIELTVENPLRDWDRPREYRFNNTTQQALYPGDKGLEFVEQAVEQETFWGGALDRGR